MRRRDFIAALTIACATPCPLRAEQRDGIAGPATVGVLWHAGSAEEEKEYLTVLQAAFRDLGYIEGKNIHFLHRFPAERPERFHVLANELVASKPDLIIAVTSLAAKELKGSTSTIPIVFVVVPDPLGAGLVDSLARPGGNLTGLSLALTDLSGKHVGLLREAVPTLSRIALLFDPNNAFGERFKSAYLKAASNVGITLRPFGVLTTDALNEIFSQIAREGFDAVITATSPIFFNERAKLGALALANRLPMLVATGEMVPYGPLLSYGQDFAEYFRKAAAYADKIMKGSKPADLPIEQPTHFRLVLNMKTAKALGLALSPTLVAAADEVIE